MVFSRNNQNDLESLRQWPKFSIRAESIPGCMFDANLVIAAQIQYTFLCGQDKFLRTLSKNGQNHVEGLGPWPPFPIIAASIQGCMFCANLVTSAEICDELSCGQGTVYGRTHGRTQPTTKQFVMTCQRVNLIDDIQVYFKNKLILCDVE